jgi:hypothetical protein
MGPCIEALKAEDPAVGQGRQTVSPNENYLNVPFQSLPSQATRKWWDEIQDKITSDAARIVDASFSNKYKEDI